MSLITIILPYFKKKEYINKTVHSLINQTYQNFEIIIVDDELSPESHKILETTKNLDKRIRLIKNLQHQGVGFSRNNAIKISQGEYLAFCDCDDLWKKNKLERQLKFMQEREIDFSFTSYELINEQEKRVGFIKAKSQLDFRKLVFSCDIGLSTVMVKKIILEKHNTYFPNLKTKEDYVLWLSLANKGVQLFGLDETLTSWRKLKNSVSSNTLQKIFDGYRVYRVYLKYNMIKSFIYLFILSLNSLFNK